MDKINRRTSRRVTAGVVAAVIVVAVIVTAVSNASAFDGKRKGFTIGVGANFSPLISYTTLRLIYGPLVQDGNITYAVILGEKSERTNRGGTGFDVMIGYSWNEHNTIAWVHRPSFYQTGPVKSLGTATVTWNHYFGPVGRSVFSIMGVGFCHSIDWSSGGYCDDSGPGAVVGIGYEFARHLSVSMLFQKGTFNHKHVVQDCTMITIGLDMAAY